MEFLKSLWKNLKEPHRVWLIFFYVFFVAIIGCTIYILVNVTGGVFAYIVYFLSAVSLVYFIYTLIYFIPKIKHYIITHMKTHKHTSMFIESYDFRTLIGSFVSFTINVLYVIMQGVLAFMTFSPWYFTLMIYYLILAGMKGMILYTNKKGLNNQLKNFKICGVMLIILTFVFSGCIILIFSTEKRFEYAGLLIYAFSFYTFFAITTSIINFFKAKGRDNFDVVAIRNINLSASLISIVVLQVAMFEAFSPSLNYAIYNAITGGVVSFMVIVIGISMIVKKRSQ